jgi:hypothetical protein
VGKASKRGKRKKRNSGNFLTAVFTLHLSGTCCRAYTLRAPQGTCLTAKVRYSPISFFLPFRVPLFPWATHLIPSSSIPPLPTHHTSLSLSFPHHKPSERNIPLSPKLSPPARRTHDSALITGLFVHVGKQISGSTFLTRVSRV